MRSRSASNHRFQQYSHLFGQLSPCPTEPAAKTKAHLTHNRSTENTRLERVRLHGKRAVKQTSAVHENRDEDAPVTCLGPLHLTIVNFSHKRLWSPISAVFKLSLNTPYFWSWIWNGDPINSNYIIIILTRTDLSRTHFVNQISVSDRNTYQSSSAAMARVRKNEWHPLVDTVRKLTQKGLMVTSSLVLS